MNDLSPNERDHAQGNAQAPIVLVQYGDFECPYSGAAYSTVKEIQQRFGDRLLYVFRQFPLSDVHPNALQAAEAAEAAAAQGRFWAMYDVLFPNQDRLGDRHLERYASQVGLDMERFREEMHSRAHVERIQQSIESGRRHGAHGTPTFFINGQFFDNRGGLWEADVLLEAIEYATGRGSE